MKTNLSLLVITTLGLFGPALSLHAQANAARGSDAPSPFATAGIPEADRVVQEYLAARAQWQELRRASLEKSREAKGAGEKKRILEELAEAEKPLLAAQRELAKRLREAEKTKQSQRPAPPSRD